MDRNTRNKLNLHPKSTDELHSALSNFELKWQNKARQVGEDNRIARF